MSFTYVNQVKEITDNINITSNTLSDTFIKYQFEPIQAKTSKSGREYFRLGAESYSSLGRLGKEEKKILASTFGQIRLWTSFESSPVSVSH